MRGLWPHQMYLACAVIWRAHGNFRWERRRNQFLPSYRDPKQSLHIRGDFGWQESAKRRLQMSMRRRPSTTKRKWRGWRNTAASPLSKPSKQCKRMEWSFCENLPVSGYSNMKMYSTNHAGVISREPWRTTVHHVIQTNILAWALSSAGCGASNLHLILHCGRSHEGIKSMCEGSDLGQGASKLLLVPCTVKWTAGRDKLRTLVSSAFLAIISK